MSIAACCWGGGGDLVSVAGTAAGGAVAFAAALGGVGALLMASALLFTVLKWAGALYLIGLGLVTLLRAGQGAVTDQQEQRAVGTRTLALESFLVAALNPKAILFYVAFAPLFLVPGAPLLTQFVVMIATYVFIAAVSDAVYAVLAGSFAPMLRGAAFQAWTRRVSGGVLMAGGALVLAARRN